mmetsp:Transcript_55810/g.149414  ORF Transcript_55810/g.149414 Transcript_55810/m.149414 type:complete len:401 (-) Transcript_55810:132-1334(-)
MSRQPDAGSDEEAPPLKGASEGTPLLPDACVPESTAWPWKRRGGEESWWTLELDSETGRTILIVLVSAALIAIGVAAGMKMEGWSFITSLYFIVQVVTTIGYGDVTPTNDVTKLWCAWYIICSLVVLACFFNIMAQHFARMQANFLRQRLREFEAVLCRHASTGVWKDQTYLEKLHTQMKELYGRINKVAAATCIVVMLVLFGTVFYRLFESCTCASGKNLVPGCRDHSHDACASSGGYVTSWTSAFYMSVVTLTTVGFGDHTPRSESGRAVCVFWMLFGVASMANWVAKLSEFFIKEQLNRDDVLREEINERTFRSMDTNGDGYLSRGEFRGYMLVRYGLVSQTELNIIDRHYDILDKQKTGGVTWEAVSEGQKAQSETAPAIPSVLPILNLCSGRTRV